MIYCEINNKLFLSIGTCRPNMYLYILKIYLTKIKIQSDNNSSFNYFKMSLFVCLFVFCLLPLGHFSKQSPKSLSFRE